MYCIFYRNIYILQYIRRYTYLVGCLCLVLDVLGMNINVNASVFPLLLLPVALEGQAGWSILSLDIWSHPHGSLTSWVGEHPKVFTMSSSWSSWSSSSSWVSSHLQNHNHDYHWNHRHYRIINHHDQLFYFAFYSRPAFKSCHIPPPKIKEPSWSWGRPWMSGKPNANDDRIEMWAKIGP